MNLGKSVRKLAFEIISPMGHRFKNNKLESNVSSTFSHILESFEKKKCLQNELKKVNLYQSFFQNQAIRIDNTIRTGKLTTKLYESSLPVTKRIIDPEIYKKKKIEIPVINSFNGGLELPCLINEEKKEPTKTNIKKAENIIRIRIRKMRKHKKKKFYKKMKFVIAKHKHKLIMRKEFVFQTGLKEILKEGSSFSAEKYLNDQISKLNWTPPITKVRGILAPKAVIEKELEIKNYKKKMEDRVAFCLAEREKN